MRTGDVLGNVQMINDMLAAMMAGKHPLSGLTSLAFGTRQLRWRDDPEHKDPGNIPAVELFFNHEIGHMQNPTNEWPILELASLRESNDRYSRRVIMFRMPPGDLGACRNFVQEGMHRHFALGNSGMDDCYECPLRALNRILSIDEEPYYDKENFPLGMYWTTREALAAIKARGKIARHGQLILAPYIPSEYSEPFKFKILPEGSDFILRTHTIGRRDELGVQTADNVRHVGFDALWALGGW